MNWLMLLNSDTLHTQLVIKFNDQTQHLFNYNACKHQNINGICVGDIKKDLIYLR
jgi:hypothetical protein